MGRILYDWIQLDECSLFKCLQYVKGNSEGIEVFPSGHLFWYSTAALQERWHWPVMKHFHAFTANTSDTWSKLSQVAHLTLTLYLHVVHVVGQRFCTKRVKFEYSFWESFGYFFVEFPAGSSSHRHTCHYCLCVKKKVIFFQFKLLGVKGRCPLSLSVSLYHSQTTWCWKTSWAASLPICPSSPSLPRQWQVLLLWWWMTLCRVAELGGLRWFHLSMKETKNVREKKREGIFLCLTDSLLFLLLFSSHQCISQYFFKWM